MASTRSPSPSSTGRTSSTDLCSDTTSIVDSVSSIHIQDDAGLSHNTVQDVLFGSRILITGAAGFVGAALLHRLLGDPSFNVKQIVAIVRANTPDEALKRLPKAIQHHALPSIPSELPKLLVVNAGCARRNFGLDEQQFQQIRKSDILIHCADDTRFTLPVSQAFEPIADLVYFTARFSLLSSNLKTHIHLSTTFVGWYLRDGSLVTESLTPQACATQVDQYDEHVNSYFHAKTYAEAIVNSLFTSQVGRKVVGKACRIVRLATLCPAIDFPRKAGGAGHPSSPVCAALAAQVADPSLVAPNSGSDVIPADIAVNQILAITASAHALHTLPLAHPLHSKNPAGPTNQHLAEVPCYHIACGRGDESHIPMQLINSHEFKIKEPYIPSKSLLKVYNLFITKTVEFDVVHTRFILGLPTSTPDQGRDINKRTIADLTLKPSSIPLDTVKQIQHKWGHGPSGAWTGYLAMVRDEMETMGPRSDWQTFVD